MITMLPATEEDARELAPLLRAEDRAEIAALSGREPAELLVESVRASWETTTYRADGALICIGGVAPLSLIGSTGVPWLMGTDLVPVHRKAFMRHSREAMPRWLARYPTLRNVVDARYAEAIRWLRWLGFRFGEPVVMGVAGLPFLPFQMEAADV
ncbi:MAG: hypothetical protein EPO41_02765 [Reyranella sp.]|uniref:hypothetical protein n=1 Tax=Reyranella sp. TaxID=1929291 RepID=UPI001225D1AD|nr:hypothetical protein [Reyranella sp.]TAJ97519.1 MAG: hypothetical protein EPO41_02765 [Reyranella sp.]